MRLRKKVCLKMYAVLKENYAVSQEKTKKIVINIEKIVRSRFAEMGADYKAFCIKIMRVFKVFY